MRKRLIFLTICAFVATIGIYTTLHSSPNSAITATENQPASKSPKAPLAPMKAPVEFIVSTLGITAPIVNVGLTPEGNMDVPSSEAALGWYEGGTLPGNAGPAVLAGHTGHPARPSVFRQLEQLKKKDQIAVKDSDGKAASFEITDIATYTPESAPRERIFGPTTATRLAIITCSGEWLPQQNTYSHRLVIYTVRVT